MIVPVLNGVRHIDIPVEKFGLERVLGGLTTRGAFNGSVENDPERLFTFVRD